MNSTDTDTTGRLDHQDWEDDTQPRISLPREYFEPPHLDRLLRIAHARGEAIVVDGDGGHVGAVGWDHEGGCPIEAVPAAGWVS